jgi:RimJ/RimL family protein N-acetyltransferase/SAM-dependent methyltransferase
MRMLCAGCRWQTTEGTGEHAMEQDFAYGQVSERFWSLSWKGTEEAKREHQFMDDIVQKAHLERAILERLVGVETVLDAGAGSGRFSVMLAKKGLRVTHFDISAAMIETARAYAEREGVLDNMTFVQGRLEDLSAFADRSFDMVLSFDAPVSYTWPHQEQVLAELVRLTDKTLLVSVSSRPGHLPYELGGNPKSQFLLDPTDPDPLIRWYVAHEQEAGNSVDMDLPALRRLWDTGVMGNPEEIREAYARGESPWPMTYLFEPQELRDILVRNGLQQVRLAGPGAYARCLPREALYRLLTDPTRREAFLSFCQAFDSREEVAGLGKDNLLAVGTRPPSTRRIPVLRTDRLLLRPFEPGDAYAAAWNSRCPRMARWLSDMVMPDAEAAAGWIRWIHGRMETETALLLLAIVPQDLNRPVGFVAYAPKEELGGGTEIVYGVADPWAGKGYATEAARALLRYGFCEGGLACLSGLVKPENEASERVLLKLGFQYVENRVLPYEGIPTAFRHLRMNGDSLLPA